MPDGSLLIGPAESIAGLTSCFVQTQEAPGLYSRAKSLAPNVRRATG